MIIFTSMPTNAGQSGCETMYNVLSKDAVTKLVKTMVTEYIMLLERSIAF